MKTKVTRLDYCQYLLVSQLNYTLTNFADYCTPFSHDALNRYVREEKITPRLVWDNVVSHLILTPHGYLIFDDTVLDKNHSFAIELVRHQYSGNAKQVIKGIGVVTCVYVNPDLDLFWLIDYRIYDPDGDGKSKLDHVREMFPGAREFEFERDTATIQWESNEGFADYFMDRFGPMVAARELLGDRFQDLKAEIIEIWDRWNEADDGSFRLPQEYLLSVIRL